jgi:hypothetical protein
MNIEEANGKLTRVKVRIKGNRLYLRATLPPKTGKGDPKQYELSTGLPNNTQGIKTALARAQRLESDLNLERFTWSDWGEKDPEDPILIEEAIASFTKSYWERHQKTKSREKNFDIDYTRTFAYLPPDEPLIEAVLKRILVQSNPKERLRARMYMAFGALARHFDVPLSKEWPKLKGEYRAKNRTNVPTDEQVQTLRNSLKNPALKRIKLS